jgi:Cu2+-exporting ATPase
MLQAGMTVLVAPGSRLPADGIVTRGRSDLDTSLVTGETTPQAVAPGDKVFAGMLNRTAALTATVTAAGDDTLLADMVRLMDAAGQNRARYVRLADRVSRIYAPVVHLAALGTFLLWTVVLGMAWQQALLIAVSVLIITCPCALGLAVPIVQVVANGRLLRRGVVLKAADGLERLAAIDTVVFDKTGTLSLGRLVLASTSGIAADDLALAASVAASSRHPLCRALVRAYGEVKPMADVQEHPGAGLLVKRAEGEIRLGSRSWCGIVGASADFVPGEADGPELWLAPPRRTPVRFAFVDELRPDAAQVVAALRQRGLHVALLSGDREAVVSAAAQAAGIADWQAACKPADKIARLDALAAAGHKVLMVGDGLNDAPALAAAHVSMSPATAADISQAAADAVFQGDRLDPVREAYDVARRSQRLVLENFVIAIGYNLLAVPLAIAGLVTPLIAAIAMSSSSIAVTVNALRLYGRGRSP